ncbi:MAG TPA: serine hydrolase [Treponemataceae bacterium]|nr:serine hydrolase [Treponemataceae bacterium]
MNRTSLRAVASILAALAFSIALISCQGRNAARNAHFLVDVSQAPRADQNDSLVDGFWEFAPPREAGVSPRALERALDAVDASGFELHSLTVARGNRIILDAYGTIRASGRPVTPDRTHALYSVTKSFVSALVSIAVADGSMPGFDSRAMEWFKKDGIANPSPEKDRMTVGNVLSMQSGLEWSEVVDDRAYREPPNAAVSFLGRPIVAAPGGKWEYSSGNSQILAEILRRATGKTPARFAEERLFGPLGISEYQWAFDRSGTNFGGWGLALRPRDLARFGLLYARGGAWEGRQIIPAGIVDETTAPRVTSPWNGSERYAYHWWVSPFGAFVARGYLGQAIYVFPSLDLVVVATGNIDNNQAAPFLDAIVRDCILPGVRAQKK